MKRKPSKFEFDNRPKNATIIDCMDCENYYTGACDARAGACNDYKPVRKITMEDDIKTIKHRLNVMFGVLITMFCVLGLIFVSIC